MRPIFARPLAICLAAAAALTFAGPASAGYRSSVIASGLNSPRGLAFGPDGGLYVAESGFLSDTGPTITVRGDEARLGATGSITRYFDGTQTRIVTGLPSIALVGSGEASSAQDIAFGADGTGYVVLGFVTDPNARADLGPGAAGLGQVYTFTGGAPAAFADVAAFEGANNPAGGPELNSNPFHVAALGGGGLLVTDAGANTLMAVGADGAVSLVGVLPGRDIGGGFPSQSVPTGVAVGPDGAYYVGELTGFPFTPGAAQVYRIVPGETPTVFRSGFTNITDIAFGDDGSLYVLEFDTDGLLGPGVGGALVRVGVDGTRSTIFDRGLITPTGLEIGDDGAFYVTNLSVAPGIGEVLRISFIPEPATWATMIVGFGLVGTALRRRATRAA